MTESATGAVERAGQPGGATACPADGDGSGEQPRQGSVSESPNVFDPDVGVPLHTLSYLPEGDEVTVGIAGTDTYVIIDHDGAELVRRLESGRTPREAGAWYEGEYGQPVDVDDVLTTLDELGFIRSPLDDRAPDSSVRWSRLGAAVFSPPAWVAYALLISWAAVATARSSDLAPSYHQLFFTDYYTLIEVVLLAAAIPQLLLHEGFHALAARRLGVRSSLSIGRRLHFVVLETSMDGLVAVPRRKRYLPILAGMLADLLVVSALTVVADLSREPGGVLSLTGRVALAIALAVWLRIAWQFSFYLRTDLYVLISTIIGCVDLHGTTQGLLRNRVNHVLGRHERLIDETSWHPTDRRAARWYSWLLAAGYALSITLFVFAMAPITLEIATGVLRTFTEPGPVTWQKWSDSAVVVGAVGVQAAVLGWLFLRDRRRVRPRRPRPLHPLAAQKERP